VLEAWSSFSDLEVMGSGRMGPSGGPYVSGGHALETYCRNPALGFPVL
jgi:hypothetical protein